MSLANKYRPQSFDQMCSQSHVVEIVSRMCQSDTLSNRNFLFTGPAGTGKTSLSRLIAKSLNGSTDNLIEIDAASHSGVDDMRELVQQASQYPVGTKYKIFLIDEVHSLSSAAWQSLLKCLEEQLAMTVFIMATTNPEKIPETILSRVQSFKLSKISSDQIYDRLKYVIECENKEGRNITYTEDALRYLSNYAGGGLRDALTNLDKVLAFGNNITTELLETALDLPNYDDYFELLNGIVKKDNTLITTIIDRVYNSGLNFVKWFEGYHSFLCNIVKYIFLRDISKTTIPSHYLPKIEKYTAQHAALCLKLSNKVLQMNKDIRNTQYLQEVALSYLLVPEAPKKPQGGNA